MRLIDADAIVNELRNSATNATLPKSIGGMELPIEIVRETYGKIIKRIESAPTVDIDAGTIFDADLEDDLK